MKTHFSVLTAFTLLWVLLDLACPASAQTLYENGPINGQVIAWTINFGFNPTDSFTIANSNSTIGGFAFGAWLLPGDVLESAEVSISTEPYGGTSYFDGTVNFTASGCFENFQGFNVCTETGTFNGPTLSAGTYWLELSNAVTVEGNPVYWDENNGVGCHSLAAHQLRLTPVTELFPRKPSACSARKAVPVPRLSLSALCCSHRERSALSNGFVDMEHPISLGGP